jgi:hypothetical protein
MEDITKRGNSLSWQSVWRWSYFFLLPPCSCHHLSGTPGPPSVSPCPQLLLVGGSGRHCRATGLTLAWRQLEAGAQVNGDGGTRGCSCMASAAPSGGLQRHTDSARRRGRGGTFAWVHSSKKGKSTLFWLTQHRG